MILRQPPDVQPQTSPGLVKSHLQDARKTRQEQKAGLTAEALPNTAPTLQEAGLTAQKKMTAVKSPPPLQPPSFSAPAAPILHPAVSDLEESFFDDMREFEAKVKSIALQKHDALHWEYQEAMKDHRGHSLRDVLEHGQDVPEDLKSSDVHQLVDDCHIVLCVSTFKRSFQLQEALALNVSQTWPWRLRVTWAIFDCNPDQELMHWAFETFSFPMQCGHIVWLRAVSPWSTFHMSVAKNTAHVAGFQTTLQDRLARCELAGLTATEAGLTAKTFVMNWDNDNILCLRWLHDCFRQSTMMASDANIQSVHPVVGMQWHNSHLGTCGRIGSIWNTFSKMGGYDESMLAMGCQDVCLVRRMALIGVVEKRTGNYGFTVSNRENQAKRFLGNSAKAKRKQAWEENAEKLKWLPEYERSLGSFKEICNHNGRIMKTRLRQKIWVVNEGKEMGVDTIRVSPHPQAWEAGSDRQHEVIIIDPSLRKDAIPQAGSDRQHDVTPQAEHSHYKSTPQVGSDHQAASSSDGPRLTPRQQSSMPFHMKHQILCVSLGTRTMAQVCGRPAASELRKLFWRDRGKFQKIHGVTFDDQDLARRLLAEVYGHEFPRECTINLVDCRMFHGHLQGHVGLHEDFQDGVPRQAQ